VRWCSDLKRGGSNDFVGTWAFRHMYVNEALLETHGHFWRRCTDSIDKQTDQQLCLADPIGYDPKERSAPLSRATGSQEPQHDVNLYM
jgi:hypothetical protein